MALLSFENATLSYAPAHDATYVTLCVTRLLLLLRRHRGAPPLIWKFTRAVQRASSTVVFAAAAVATVLRAILWTYSGEFHTQEI